MQGAKCRRILPCLLVLALLVALPSGCAPRPAVRGAPRPLPPDSAALLARALRTARPAFDTQEEALRSGVYAAAEPPAPVAVAPPPLQGRPLPSPPPSTATPPARPTPAAAPAPAAPAPPAADVSESGAFVIQVAAFRDEASARAALVAALRDHPRLLPRVEEGGGLYRVILGGWQDVAAAEGRLAELQEAYPTAWIRRRTLP